MNRNTKIGLTVLSALLLLYLGVTWVKRIQLFSKDSNVFVSYYEDLSGLKKGDQVSVYGYPMGFVSEIDILSRGAKVTFEVDKKVEIHSDAVAKIMMKELMGSKKIELSPGKSNDILLSGAEIKGNTSLDIAAAMDELGSVLKRIDYAQIESMVNNLDRLTANLANLIETVDTNSLSNTFNAIENITLKLDRTLSKVEQQQLIDKIEGAISNVNRLAVNIDSTFEVVEGLIQKIDNNTLPKVDDVFTKANSLLSDADKMMGDLESVTEKLKGKKTVVGKLLNDEVYARELDQTIENLNKTLTHIRTKKIYVHMSLRRKQYKDTKE